VARGQIFVTGVATPGLLFRIDPRVTFNIASAVLEANDLGGTPQGIAYDGSRIWTANFSGSVSIRSFAGPGSTTTITAEYVAPIGILYDGTHIWVTDQGDGQLKKVNSIGLVVGRVAVGSQPMHPVFDGMNIWVPNAASSSVTVVRVKDSAGNPLLVPFVLATLTGNGLNTPQTAAFDGQRVLVTNALGHSVSLWKAADLTSLGQVPTGNGSFPFGACSDGINFWITLNGSSALARF